MSTSSSRQRSNISQRRRHDPLAARWLPLDLSEPAHGGSGPWAVMPGGFGGADVWEADGVDFAADHPGAFAIVEVGCGSAAIEPNDPGQCSVGVDIDLDALRDPGRSRNGVYVCADAQKLPFRDGACTAVAVHAVLHHLTPTESALAELARVLEPGGVLTVTDGVALAPAESKQLNDELAAAGIPLEPVNGFDLDDLRSAIKTAGLRIDGLRIEGTATFATPPYVSRPYTTDRFVLTASHP